MEQWTLEHCDDAVHWSIALFPPGLPGFHFQSIGALDSGTLG